VEAPKKWQNESRWQAVKDRIVLVQKALFSQVVNSNLEVRTSVSIDPFRGAAEEGALFTYEAIPRASFLQMEVVLDDYRDGQGERPFPVEETKMGDPLPNSPWEDPLDVVKAGLRMAEWLGVGGMGTRGFGRIAIVGEPLEQSWGEEGWK
jgi:CRISPR-associated protein Cmr4